MSLADGFFSIWGIVFLVIFILFFLTVWFLVWFMRSPAFMENESV